MTIASHPNQNTLAIYIYDGKMSRIDSTKYLGSFIDSPEVGLRK